MPGRSDDARRLTGARLCEITGVNRQTRDKWARDGLVRKRAAYEQLDLLELVVLHVLLGVLRKKDAKVAWQQVRPQLRELVPTPELTLVWDTRRRAAQLAYDAETIVSLVRHGRPVQVLDLGSRIQEAREAYQRDTAPGAVGDIAARGHSARARRRHKSS